MLDRHGKQIRVGCSATEMVLIQAALTLDRHEKTEGLKYIAERFGRSLQTVRDMAARLYQTKLDDRAAARVIQARQSKSVPVEASQITPPSKARLMAGRA